MLQRRSVAALRPDGVESSLQQMDGAVVPSYILTALNGKNIGNEANIFHEALHGLLGIQDQFLFSYLGQSASCNITEWILNQVLFDGIANSPYDSNYQPCN